MNQHLKCLCILCGHNKKFNGYVVVIFSYEPKIISFFQIIRLLQELAGRIYMKAPEKPFAGDTFNTAMCT